MTKDELLAKAAQLGITTVSDENTKAEIAEAITEAEANVQEPAKAANSKPKPGIKYLKYPSGICVPVKAKDAEAHRARIESEINDFDLIGKGKAVLKRIEIIDAPR